MVKIRLKRMGMKKKPFYRVVVADELSLIHHLTLPTIVPV